MVAMNRENGLTIVELGRLMQKDQKSMFHIVRVLVQLGLCVKFKVIANKVATNRDDDTVSKKGQRTKGNGFAPTPVDIKGKGMEKQTVNAAADREGEEEPQLLLPIGPEHLNTNRSLVAKRIVRALKERDNMNKVLRREDLGPAIGLRLYTKEDKRKLASLLRTLYDKGVLELIKVPIMKVNGEAAFVKCLRLVDRGKKEDNELENLESALDGTTEKRRVGSVDICFPALNISIDRQIVDLLLQVGPLGMLNINISMLLGELYIRLVDQALMRLERDLPPSNLRDLTVVSVLEFHGREKRARFFTLDAYKMNCFDNGLDPIQALKATEAGKLLSRSGQEDGLDASGTGGWSPLETVGYYQTVEELQSYCAKLDVRTVVSVGSKKNTKRAPIDPVTGEVKKGRPRKYPVGSTAADRRKLKQEGEESIPTGSLTKARSRKGKTPRKKGLEKDVDGEAEGDMAAEDTSDKASNLTVNPTKEKQKAVVIDVDAEAGEADPSKKAKAIKEVSTRTARRNKRQRLDEEAPEVDEPSTKRPKRKSTRIVPEPAGTSQGDLSPSPDKMTLKKTKDPPSAAPISNHTRPLRVTRSTVDALGGTDSQSNTVTIEALDDGPRNSPSTKDPVNDTSNAGPPKRKAAELTPERPSKSSRVEGEVIHIVEANEIPGVTTARRSNASRQKRILTTVVRQTELLSLVKECGGMIDLNHEFYRTLTERNLQAISRSTGKQTYSVDKRSLNSDIVALVDEGLLKKFETQVPGFAAQQKKTILHLPDIMLTSPEMQAFMLTIQNRALAPPKKKTDNVPSATATIDRGPLSEFSPDEGKGQKRTVAVIRGSKEYFAAHWRVSSQRFGYSLARFVRAKDFHRCLIQLSQTSHGNHVLVGKGARIVSMAALFQEIPLRVYTSVIPIATVDPGFQAFYAENKDVLLKNLPQTFQEKIKLLKSISRDRMLRYLELLQELGLLHGLCTVPVGTADSLQVDIDGLPLSFGFVETSKDASHWCLHDWAGVYSLQSPEMPLQSLHAVSDSLELEVFWTELERASVFQPSNAVETSTLPPSQELSARAASLRIPLTFQGDSVLVESLKKSRNWTKGYILTDHQKSYLRSCKSSGEVNFENIEEVETLADTLLAPADVVMAFLQTGRKSKKKATKRSWKATPATKANLDSNAAQEARKRIAYKAKKAGEQRTKDWDAMINRFLKMHNLDCIDKTLQDQLYHRYINQPSPTTVKMIQDELNNWLRSRSADQPFTQGMGNTSLITIQRVPLLRPSKKTPRAPFLPVVENIRESEVRRRKHFTTEEDVAIIEAAVILKARATRLGFPTIKWSEAKGNIIPDRTQDSAIKRAAILLKRKEEFAYYSKLLQAWTHFYNRKVQENNLPEELQDDNPLLMDKHFMYLRDNLDRDRIRHDCTQDIAPTDELDLPSDSEDFLRTHDVKRASDELVMTDNDYWAHPHKGRVNHNLRAKELVSEVFARRLNLSASEDNKAEALDRKLWVTTQAIKMMTALRTEDFDGQKMASMLQETAGEEITEEGIEYLHETGCLVPAKGDLAKRVPGRNYAFSDRFSSSFIQPVMMKPSDQATRSLFELVRPGISDDLPTIRPFNILTEDWEVMMLTSLVSHDQVDVDVDTSVPQQHLQDHPNAEAKGFEDEWIECELFLSAIDETRMNHYFCDLPPIVPPTFDLQLVDLDVLHSRVSITEDKATCCYRPGESALTDCLSCLQLLHHALLQDLAAKGFDAENVDRWVNMVKDAGENGIELKSLDVEDELLDSLVTSPHTVFFWSGTGDDAPRLTHFEFLSQWCAKFPVLKAPQTRANRSMQSVTSPWVTSSLAALWNGRGCSRLHSENAFLSLLNSSSFSKS
ncbi:hypothetical protein BT69DRAFT_551626 [Atractiella rhizophila]|nr:hypothetical protein BT69DRAFT_551626 [Atractiella rhizophila]